MPSRSNRILYLGVAAVAAYTALIALLGPRLDAVPLLPDQGASWYYWKLPDPTVWTRLSAWGGFGLHLAGLWAMIAWAQRNRIGYGSGLHRVNRLALAWNAAFILLHLLQSHLFYDGLAQDVSIWSSLASVAVLLIWVLLLENDRRGLFFGKKIPVSAGIRDAAKRYHGYYFAWALTYTFWYHPTVSTPGHLFGFFYLLLILFQGSLFFTPWHLNRRWTLLLELGVVGHGTVVAVSQPHGLWPMFLFGFLGIFVVTQMHGLGLSRAWRWALGLAWSGGALAVYIPRGPAAINEVLRIPIIDYVGVFLLMGVLWLVARLLPSGPSTSSSG